MVNREELMKTKSLEDAINLLFNRVSSGRDCIFTQEAMTGCVASEYDYLGKSGRQETYEKIAEDFKRRTDYKEKELKQNIILDFFKKRIGHKEKKSEHNIILDVGCGSGLLSLELAEKTDAIIYGIDTSEDMLRLASDNLDKRYEDTIEKIKKEYEAGGVDFSRPIPAAYDIMPEIVGVAQYNKDRIRFVRGNVYDISKMSKNKQIVNFIVCRNALHRFQFPEKAIKQMYEVLAPSGKIYIRDLRRDADWKTILERIGEKRWQTKTLVEDYIGAMASMLTTKELEKTLGSLGITNFKLTDGRYINGELKSPNNIKEYEKDTEYVCIIQK